MTEAGLLIRGGMELCNSHASFCTPLSGDLRTDRRLVWPRNFQRQPQHYDSSLSTQHLEIHTRGAVRKQGLESNRAGNGPHNVFPGLIET